MIGESPITILLIAKFLRGNREATAHPELGPPAAPLTFATTPHYAAIMIGTLPTSQPPIVAIILAF